MSFSYLTVDQVLDPAVRLALWSRVRDLRASNGAARGLYEASGFVVVGRRPRYYPGGEDALLMTLDLPERTGDSE